MKFFTNETHTETIELNTLSELKAYAMGGTGKIEIDYCEIHPMTGETLPLPVITSIERN